MTTSSSSKTVHPQDAKKLSIQSCIDDLLQRASVGAPQLSPDGRTIVFPLTEFSPERQEYIHNIYRVTSTGGAPTALTTRRGSDGQPRWSPNGDSIAFVSDRPGDGPQGKSQIWLLPAQGGEAVQLTQVGGGAHSPRWAPDGGSLLFLSAETAGPQERQLLDQGGIRLVDQFIKMTQLWIVDPATGACRQLTRDRSTKANPAWAPDSRRIVFEQRADPTSNHTYKSRLYTIDTSGKKRRQLTREPGCDTQPNWSPDGCHIAFLHRAEPRYTALDQLAVYPLDGGPVRHPLPDLDRNVSAPVWAANSRAVYFTVQDGVRQQLHRLDLDSDSAVPLTRGNQTVSHPSLGPDNTLALHLETADRPGQLHLLAAGRKRQLTRFNSALNTAPRPKTRAISWRATDGLRIEGLLILPPKYEPGHPLPTIVEPHGGPAGNRSFQFAPKSQALARAGYVVLAPNFRGSTGYGDAFMQANHNDFGGGDFADMMSGVDYLVDQGLADPDRLGITGGSYGGFMTGWAIGHTDRFKAAVAGAGVFNLLSFYGTTDIQWFTEHYQRGTPWQQRQAYLDQSPISYIDRINTPTLLYHGDEDRRVPMEQTEQFYTALKRRRQTVEFVRYPRAGHGLSEYLHVRDNLERTLAWFARYL